MPFPSVLSTFNKPTATDRLNSPSHSALHNTVSSAVGQIEAVIGVEGANSVVGTLEYLIKSPDSDGGGHVQTAVKGGTGQTTFTKGDILVATGASVLSKLTIGLDGQAIVANSSTALGMNWASPAATKINTSASVQTIIGTENPTILTSILSVTIPGSTLGTSNAVRATLYISNWYMNANSVLVRATYGGNTVASIMAKSTGNVVNASISGELRYTLIANNNTDIQRGILQLSLGGQGNQPAGVTSVVTISLYNMNTSSVHSSAGRIMGIETTNMFQSAVNIDGITVEKIV